MRYMTKCAGMQKRSQNTYTLFYYQYWRRIVQINCRWGSINASEIETIAENASHCHIITTFFNMDY